MFIAVGLAFIGSALLTARRAVDADGFRFWAWFALGAALWFVGLVLIRTA